MVLVPLGNRVALGGKLTDNEARPGEIDDLGDEAIVDSLSSDVERMLAKGLKVDPSLKAPESLLGLAINVRKGINNIPLAEARRTIPPKRIRYPTGYAFASSCSPPRLRSRRRKSRLLAR